MVEKYCELIGIVFFHLLILSCQSTCVISSGHCFARITLQDFNIMLCTHCSFEWSKLKRVSNLALRNACVRSMGIVWKEFDYSRSSKLVILWHACSMNFQLANIGWDGHLWNPMVESYFSAFVITTKYPSIAFLSNWINKFQLTSGGAESTQWNGPDKTQ